MRGSLAVARPRGLTLQGHLVVMIAAIVLLQFALTWAVISDAVSGIVREQIGERALQTALAVAEMPEIRARLARKDQSGAIQELAEELRKKTGAEYIVVGDSDGIRYSHPVPERIGKSFVGGDTGAVLKEGRAYVSEATGTLGPAIRGMAPIRFGFRNVIGFVSVGYLKEDVQGLLQRYLQRPLLYLSVLMGLGVFWAIYVARHFKKRTLGLEPEEITQLFLQREAILEAIRAGVVSTDDAGIVRVANRAALTAAGAEKPGEIVGTPAKGAFPDLGLDEVLATGQPLEYEERTIGGRDMVVNATAIRTKDRLLGAVATFRPKDEMQRIAQELARVREYGEFLRAQSHEHSNKLHTIAGLLEIGAYQEAQDFVCDETSGYQAMVDFLHRAVPHPVVAGIILGKYARARELKVTLEIAPDSQMIDLPERIDQEQLVTVLGNLLENAFEAMLDMPEGQREVLLSFTDLGDEVLFEVEDHGPGIAPERSEAIFERGVSSKGGDRRGLGLYLVRRAVEKLGGYVTVGSGEAGGALFTVALPKELPVEPAKEAAE
ncbi:sensor histidine kinase [Tropicimonas sp. TH_r6]|uniref:sensor histidine kinase n=1 Tax=Tropicimonas sp. TH_r6 TaxID=3082085 RepID=UPI002952F8DE|nr:sensor histidine kinase [Tropicimonas sp. TH_r6]MDV7142125.1 sensor histidine kinase [Tropicimonas sp. TH_r6]